MFFKVLSSLLFTIAGASAVVDVSPFDFSLFRDLNVTRGLVYHYYAVPADTGKPTLLFLHGYPSSSYDWRHQVSFFQDRGYGLIVPDMLGYGGTAKPLDPQLYVSSLITKDIVDILDAEGIDKAVVIGHDWGSKTTSRLANYFPERFHSFAFLSVGYTTPLFFSTPYEEANNLVRTRISKAVLGFESAGYWDFLASEGADQILLEHLDSFFDIAYPKETFKVITDLFPLGALEAWVTNDTRTPPVDYVTPEERAIQMEFFRQSGLAAPHNWYKIVRGRLEGQDDQGIPPENAIIQKPVFFGVALRDYGNAAAFISAAVSFSNDTLTIHEYNSGHWVMLEVKDEFNDDLLRWIENQGLDG